MVAATFDRAEEPAGPGPLTDLPDPPAERSSWTAVDRWRVHARVWDDGRSVDPPIVLVHGLGVGSRMCQPAAEVLARRFKVLAPDLPGFGDTEGPDEVLPVDEQGRMLSRWATALDLAPPLLVGVSLGAQVVAEAARLRPELARAVVLGSPIVDDGRRSWPQQLVRWQLEQRTQSWRMRGLMVHDIARAGPARTWRTFRDAMRHRIEDTVPLLGCPVLVAWGTDDPLLSRDWVERLAAGAREGELRVLPGAVHNLAHESPLELARVVHHLVETVT